MKTFKDFLEAKQQAAPATQGENPEDVFWNPEKGIWYSKDPTKAIFFGGKPVFYTQDDKDLFFQKTNKDIWRKPKTAQAT